MFFTQEDYKKIQTWLNQNAIKDSEFKEASLPLNEYDIISFVQNGNNVKVRLKDFLEQLFLLREFSDFINVTDKYKAKYILLKQAIQLVPYKTRKIGQVITFLNEEKEWKIYQFKGESVNQWNEESLWEDIIKAIQGSDLVADEEDLTEVVDEVSGKSLLKLKDKAYDPDNFSGLGRVILRKNIVTVLNPDTQEGQDINLLTQQMINKPNTIYEIQYDFDLNNQEITIPEGCVLDFKGGSLSNGTLNGYKLNIKSIIDNILYSVIIKFEESNTLKASYWNNDIEDVFNKYLQINKYKLEFPYNKEYLIKDSIVIFNKNVEIDFNYSIFKVINNSSFTPKYIDKNPIKYEIIYVINSNIKFNNLYIDGNKNNNKDAFSAIVLKSTNTQFNNICFKDFSYHCLIIGFSNNDLDIKTKIHRFNNIEFYNTGNLLGYSDVYSFCKDINNINLLTYWSNIYSTRDDITNRGQIFYFSGGNHVIDNCISYNAPYVIDPRKGKCTLTNSIANRCTGIHIQTNPDEDALPPNVNIINSQFYIEINPNINPNDYPIWISSCSSFNMENVLIKVNKVIDLKFNIGFMVIRNDEKNTLNNVNISNCIFDSTNNDKQNNTLISLEGLLNGIISINNNIFKLKEDKIGYFTVLRFHKRNNSIFNILNNIIDDKIIHKYVELDKSASVENLIIKRPNKKYGNALPAYSEYETEYYYNDSDEVLYFWDKTKWNKIKYDIDKKQQGTTQQRPADVKAGFYYFDTTLNKPIWKKDDTSEDWVDATGAKV